MNFIALMAGYLGTGFVGLVFVVCFFAIILSIIMFIETYWEEYIRPWLLTAVVFAIILGIIGVICVFSYGIGSIILTGKWPLQ
jgi:hypothetical protein